MLSASSRLDFVDEAFLFCPRWLHKDLATNVRQHVGTLNSASAKDRLVEFLYSGVPYGWFWQNIQGQLDRDMFYEELSGEELDLYEIFRAVMVVHARMRNKTGVGAKFPAHYSATDRLVEWFPNCKLIHTTRNPKAVYASQAAKYEKNAPNSAAGAYLRFKHFVHINIQTAWTAAIHKRFDGLPNYRLVRYEETVQHPRRQIEELCEFLGVRFEDEMLHPKQYGSSFNNRSGNKGVDTSSLRRYEKTISGPAQQFMDIVHARAYRTLGYEK